VAKAATSASRAAAYGPYRWAEGEYDRLPSMAADLVRRACVITHRTSPHGPVFENRRDFGDFQMGVGAIPADTRKAKESPGHRFRGSQEVSLGIKVPLDDPYYLSHASRGIANSLWQRCAPTGPNSGGNGSIRKELAAGIRPVTH
jgi:hypothetical protein